MSRESILPPDLVMIITCADQYHDQHVSYLITPKLKRTGCRDPGRISGGACLEESKPRDLDYAEQLWLHTFSPEPKRKELRSTLAGGSLHSRSRV